MLIFAGLAMLSWGGWLYYQNWLEASKPPPAPILEISVDDLKRMMQLPALERSTAELTHHYEGAYKKTLQIVPEDEVIGFCFPNNGWAYPLYDSDLSRQLKYIPIDDLTFIQAMNRQNIKYLFIERLTPEQIQLIQQAVQQGHLRKIEEFLYALEQG